MFFSIYYKCFNRLIVDILACIPFIFIFERVAYTTLKPAVEALDPAFGTLEVSIQELIFSDYIKKHTELYYQEVYF